MTPAQFRAALAALGWSLRELSRRLGCSMTLPTRWAAGQGPVPAELARWLGLLAAAIGRYPVPVWRTGRRQPDEGSGHRDPKPAGVRMLPDVPGVREGLEEG